MRVSMIGAGYVGLVASACFADFGYRVTCIDKDARRIGALNGGELPIYEPGLHDMIAANLRAGRLAFIGDTASIAESDVVFRTVGTTSRVDDGQADLSYIFEAVITIAPLLYDTADDA